MMYWVFFGGLLIGGVMTGLWMRARLARLEAAKHFAESGVAKMQESFQALADAALRSNQSTFLDAARATLASTLETGRAQMSGDLAQKQTAIEGSIGGMVQPLADSLGRLEVHVRELERARERRSEAWASRCKLWRARPRRFPPPSDRHRPAAVGAK